MEYGGQIDLSKECVDEKGETQKSFDEQNVEEYLMSKFNKLYPQKVSFAKQVSAI